MSANPKLVALVDQLAIQTVMVESDDLATLGTILENLERIEKMEGEEIAPLRPLCGALKHLTENMILREMPDQADGPALIREGVRVLQRKLDQPFGSGEEERAIREKLESLLGKKTDSPALPPTAEPAVPEKPAQAAPSVSPDPGQDMDLCRDFVTEAIEHLNTIELNIINLEQNPEDKETLNAIFRPFHTIKGVSGFLNLKQINQFAHAMESLLDEARNHRLRIHRAMIDFILDAMDFLKGMILDLKSNLDSGRIGLSPFPIEDYLKKIALLQKGGGPVDPEEPLQPLAPVADSPQSPHRVVGEILCSKGIVSPQALQEALREQTTDKAGRKIGEILIDKKEVKPKEILEALREQKKGLGLGGETTIRVETQKLDNLVDLVGELVIAQSLVQQNSAFTLVHDQKLSRDFSQMKRITNDLQRISMTLRMIPIRQTFQKMIRLVRDLAHKSAKSIDLAMSGEETEIDRSMVDQLYDPLVHMIRNSVDHGIESPAERKERGKGETGRVFLRAYQKGGYIIIEIEDDGQGLNRSKILKKAKERGLVHPEASLTESQIDNLIFEAGFSTADRVTDVSGRGVGMDVVRRAIEQLRGKVEIFSVEGKGCRFVIRLPLTLAIMDGIIVRVGGERYIIPTVFIKEILRPKQADLTTVKKRGELIKVRGSLLPLIRLYRLLEVTPEKKEIWESLVVVVENEDRQRGLIVDDLIGKQEVVVKNLGEKLKKVKGIAGATIMGDGQVGLILDVHGIFEIDLDEASPKGKDAPSPLRSAAACGP